MMKRLILLMIALSFMLVGCNTKSNEEVENNSVEMPYVLDEGKVIIYNLFESSTLNPDFNNELGEDIASLEITNKSDSLLEHALITLKMSDGVDYEFEVNDLPANQSMWVFEKSNQSHVDTSITSVQYQTSYKDFATLHQDEITVDVDGFIVNLTNITDHDISNITITCHAMLDGTIYGGVVYQYNIQDLPSGQSVSFEASDCFMDSCMVVELAY